jgi:hypothetical protein
VSRWGLSLCSSLVAVIAFARAAAGQAGSLSIAGSIDVGSAVLRQPPLSNSAVATIGSELRIDGLRAALGISSIAALTSDGRWTGQAVLSGAAYAPPLQRARWEVSGLLTGFGVDGGGSTASAQLLAREHIDLDRGGIFGGIGGARVMQEWKARPALLAQAGGFVRLDPFGMRQLSAAFAYTDVQPKATDEFLWPRVRYADAVGYFQSSGPRMELLLGTGVRVIPRATSVDGEVTPLRTATWVSASATWWMTSNLAIVAGAGRALEDALRGVPTARYASLALRIGVRSGGLMSARPRDAAPSDHSSSLPRLVVTRAGAEDETRTLTVHAPAAEIVELMADFTGWEAVSLNKQDSPRGSWTLTRALSAGTHRVAIRLDRGEWIVPANLPRVADDFGGMVGLVTVP